MIKEYQVYYYRSIEMYGRGQCTDFEPGETHAFIKSVYAEHINDVYRKMQGFVWSPEGEAVPLIKAAGVYHTSMSVGDVVIDGNGNAWMVMPFGWKQVVKKYYSVW